MNWRRRCYITNPKRRWWEADVGGGVTYRIDPVPFVGWEAERADRSSGLNATLSPTFKTKAEAVAWCENDYAQREMEMVGIA
jgi:hypothetical protein